ncbi:hypothetical protein [Marinoscillum furvescens]|uniref:Uncharacterized protein n=1 Tax=Marinoscillum furvescens DSM 4134 TaxID=1122208 RepID=A0A3D9KZB5_MARFU|nr:hypothetical protein [Marinoscillum furvescens]RED92198.1 hypothetical protein C7460_13210 [Marinoscillum furvescens DSM 4134]
MNKIFALILTACSLTACTQLPVHQSIQANTPAADAPATYYNKDSQLTYKITHDDDSIYLTLSTANAATQARILRGGLSVWIDPSGKKKQALGFSYPVVERSQNPRNRETRPRDEGRSRQFTDRAQQMYRRFEASNPSLQLTGFAGEGITQLFDPMLDPTPVKVATNMDESGTLSYTASIARQHIGKRVFTIGVVANEMPAQPNLMAENRPSDGQQPAGEGRMGGGRHGGPGGMGGGMRPGGNGSQRATSTTIDFWFAVSLQD